MGGGPEESMMENINDQITSYLVEKGLIQKEDLEKSLSPGESLEGLSVEEHLVRSGLLSPELFHSAIEEFYGVPIATPEDYPQEPVLVSHLSISFLRESKMIPARLQNKELTVIMSNPLDYYTLDAVRLATGYEIRVLYGKEESINWALEQAYGSGTTSMEKIIEDMEGVAEYRGEEEENIDHLRDMASEGPVIRLVNLIITRAIELRASDIHFEPFEDQFRVRYRVDGVLHDVESPPKRLQAAVVSR
jgi:general secretion pathway protein E